MKAAKVLLHLLISVLAGCRDSQQTFNFEHEAQPPAQRSIHSI
jgi:hypothetical protein